MNVITISIITVVTILIVFLFYFLHCHIWIAHYGYKSKSTNVFLWSFYSLKSLCEEWQSSSDLSKHLNGFWLSYMCIEAFDNAHCLDNAP